MTRAIRSIREDLGLVDMIIELADARIPVSSRNPDIGDLCGNKLRLLVFTKADLADEKRLRGFIEVSKGEGIETLSVSLKSSSARSEILKKIDSICREKRERDKKRGLLVRPVRALVAGIPNVGKSTLINLLAGKSAAKTGNKPGVTRGKQWIQTGKDLLLLDSPGLLWPRTGDTEAGELLAVIGSMNDDRFDMTGIAAILLKKLELGYPSAVNDRYGIEVTASDNSQEILEKIAVKRGFLGAGAVPDINKAAGALIDDMRKGKLGGIVLDGLGEEEHETGD